MTDLTHYDRAIQEMRDSTLTPRETFLRAAHAVQFEDYAWLGMLIYLRDIERFSSRNRTTSANKGALAASLAA